MSTTIDGPDDPTPTAAKDGHDADRDTDRDSEGVEDERSRLATHPDPTVAEPMQLSLDGRSQVEWVPPTQLAARGGATVLGRARDLDQQLMCAVRDAAREQRQALTQRLAARDQDVALTGAGRSSTRTAGREGVSR